MNEIAGEAEYVWHFKLSADTGGIGAGDGLTGMVREQLQALLRCVILTDHGANLKVTGFRFLDEPGVVHSLHANSQEAPSHEGH